MFIRDGRISVFSVTPNGIKGFIGSGGKKYYFRSDRECAVRFKTLETVEFSVWAEPTDERENCETRQRMREIRENLGVKFVDHETPQGVLWCQRHVYYRAQRNALESAFPNGAIKTYPFLKAFYIQENIPIGYDFEEREITPGDLMRVRHFIQLNDSEFFYTQNLRACFTVSKGIIIWPNEVRGAILVDHENRRVSLLLRKAKLAAAAAAA